MEAPKKKKRKKGEPKPKGGRGDSPWISALIWVVGLGLPILLGYFFITKVIMRDPPEPKNPFPPVALSKEQSEAFRRWAQDLCVELTEGRADDAHKRVHWPAVGWQVQHSMRLSNDERRQVEADVNKAWEADVPGIFRLVLHGERATKAQVLRTSKKRREYPAALLRCSPKPGRVEYYDIMIAPEKDKPMNFQIVDIYDYTLGAYATEMIRRQGLVDFSIEKKFRRPWLVAFGESAADHLPTLKTLMMDETLDRGAQALDNIDSLPESVRNSAHIASIELKALRKVFDGVPTTAQTERMIKLLNEPPLHEEHEIVSGALLGEVHARFKRVPEREAALRKASEQIGGDPLLLVMVGESRLAADDIPGAEAAARDAAYLEPQMFEIRQLRDQIQAKKDGK
jgi:hypothetical protein